MYEEPFSQKKISKTRKTRKNKKFQVGHPSA